MCWFSMAKYLLFAFNFVLWLGGAAVLGVGIWLVESGNEHVEVVGITIYESGAYVLIAAGSAAFLLGFLGCCGASKENTCLLGLYFGCVLVLVILQVAVGIWALANFNDIDDAVATSLDAFDLSKQSNADAYRDIEQAFQCCGKTNNTCQDWKGEISPYNPYGCECDPSAYTDATICKAYPTECTPTENKTYDFIFTKSCQKAITDFVIDNMEIIAGIGLAIGLIEILGLIFSCCMCQAIKKNQGYA
uniref:CD9 antigen-like n=1 Tax=Styela clava TaxID=7725 RepID=UPI001939F7DF|nr:CD9 antigen-like [Styela clava]